MWRVVIKASLITFPLTFVPFAIYKIISYPQNSLLKKVKEFEKQLEINLKTSLSKISELEEKNKSTEKQLVEKKRDYWKSIYELKEMNSEFDYLTKYKKSNPIKRVKTTRKIRTSKKEKILKKTDKIVKKLSRINPKIYQKTQQLYGTINKLFLWKNYYSQLKMQKISLEKKYSWILEN